MATSKKSVISQLQSVSEGALGKLTQSGATRSALQGAKELKDRGERLVHGLESIESRLAAIEERLSAIEGAKSKRAPARARSTAAKPRATTARTARASKAATAKAKPGS